MAYTLGMSTLTCDKNFLPQMDNSFAESKEQTHGSQMGLVSDHKQFAVPPSLAMPLQVGSVLLLGAPVLPQHIILELLVCFG